MSYHELKQLPEGHFRCDECGVFFASTEGHHYFARMETAENRVQTLGDALTALYDDCCKGGFYITQKVEAVVDKALAAKEPTLRGNVNRGCLGCLTDDCKHWDDDSCKEFSGCLLGRNLAAKEPTA